MILIRCHVPVLCSNLVELLAVKTICQNPVYKVSGLVVKDSMFFCAFNCTGHTGNVSSNHG